VSFHRMINRDKSNAKSKADFFVTPGDAVRGLLYHEKFTGTIHEPACGNGAIVNEIRNNPVTYADKYYHPWVVTNPEKESISYSYDLMFDINHRKDYLSDTTIRDNVVTNPPYIVAEEFAHHAIKHTRRKVAFLVRLMFLEGQRRVRKLHLVHRPSRIYVFAYRLGFLCPGQKKPSGMVPYCWIVWDNEDTSGVTTTSWILREHTLRCGSVHLDEC